MAFACHLRQCRRKLFACSGHVTAHCSTKCEVARLERRIETLRLTKAPHAAIMISTYERMIDRKKGFLKNWDMQGNTGY